MSGTDVVDLDDLATRTMKHADALRTASQRFHGYEDPQTGEKVAGVKLRFEEALDEARIAIVTEAEESGKRAPAEKTLDSHTRKRVKREHPDLYDEYHALDATVRRIKRWLSDADSAIRARQSVLKTERELVGHYGRQSQAGVGQ